MNIIDFRVKQMEFKSERSMIRAKYENQVHLAKAEYLAKLQRLEQQKNREMLALAAKEDECIRMYRLQKEAQKATGVIDDIP